MTADAHAAGHRLPARTPAGVRAALVAKEREEFEAEYHWALARAGAEFDLTPVHELVERWWRIAVLSSDPAAHQRMLANVAAIRRGQDVPSTPWSQVRRELGL